MASSSSSWSSSSSSSSWCDLPSDLYGGILRRLPSCIDRVPLAAVCRDWRVCARQHSPRLPMRVTRTALGTHVVHVRGLSRLLQEHRQCVGGGFVDSPAFDVAGLHWAIRIRCYPPADGDGSGGGGDDGGGHGGVFVMLLTEGAAAWAYVGLLLLDQTTGLRDTLVWDEHRTRFDAATPYRAWARARATGGKLLAGRSELMGSRFVRGDCLKIECVLDDVDVCRDQDRDPMHVQFR